MIMIFGGQGAVAPLPRCLPLLSSVRCMYHGAEKDRTVWGLMAEWL